MFFESRTLMHQDQSPASQRFHELNRIFLLEIENGKGWEELRYLMDEMKELAKHLDGCPARVVNFTNYNLGQTGAAGA